MINLGNEYLLSSDIGHNLITRNLNLNKIITNIQTDFLITQILHPLTYLNKVNLIKYFLFIFLKVLLIGSKQI